MVIRDSPHVLPFVVAENLNGIPSVLSDLNRKLAHPETLPSRMEADVSLLSSLLRATCEQEAILNPKTHFFVLMLMSIMRNTGERVATCGAVDVALPRHPRAHLETLADWQPKSCMAEAISLILLDPHEARSECATLESPTTSGASLVEEAQSYVTEETTDDEAMDFDFEHDAESETSSSPEENSDLDISATQLHLLSRPSASTPFCIPAVCMASHETILDVMASALQQRRAWGLADVPLLGLAFHPCSTRLNTFWGWFDEQGTGTEYCVPVPRVAFTAAPVCVQRPSLFNSYDLSDKASALAFAQLLHLLQPQFHALRSAGEQVLCAGIVQGGPPVWRADTPMERIDGLTTDDRVRSWLEKSEVLRVGSVAPPCPSLLCSPPLSALSPMPQEKKKASIRAITRSGTQSTGSGSSSHLQIPGQGIIRERTQVSVPSSTSSAASTTGSRKSASEFAHSYADDQSGFNGVDFWGLSRTVIVRSFGLPPSEAKKVKPEDTRPWHRALAEYHDIARPGFPLFENMIQPGRGDATVHAGNDAQTEGKEDNGEDILERCVLALMSTIDLVVEIAQEYRIIAEDMGNSVVPEASWRILWDFLSSAVPVQLELMGAGDSSTVDVLDILEETLRLPQPDKYIEDMVGTASGREYSLAINTLLTSENTSAARVAREASGHATDLVTSKRLETLQRQADYAVEHHSAAFNRWLGRWHPKRRDYAKSPLRAKADGLWALAVEKFFDTPDLIAYLERNPEFQPLQVASQIFRHPSHAPHPATSTAIYRTEDLMKKENLTPVDQFHFLSHTMAGGVLCSGFPSPSRKSSLRRSKREQRLDDLRKEAMDRARNSLPRIPDAYLLLIPFFIREYKRLLEHPKDSGVFQCRMALAAAVKFLGVLGVSESPTYGLVTEGPLGSVHMAVGIPQTGDKKVSLTESPDELAVHVFERGATLFDLRQRESAVAYVAFLIRLHMKVAPGLAKKLEGAQAHVRESLKSSGGDSRLAWSMLQNSNIFQIEEDKKNARRPARQNSKPVPRDKREGSPHEDEAGA